MKFRTTAKDIRNGYSRIISIGYCDAQRLLRDRYPIAYTCGVYGWNFDVYDVGDIVPGAVICTGYRGMPAGVKYNWELLRDAEKAAEAGGNREELLAAFVKEAIKP